MKKNPNHRTNIVGAGEVGYAIAINIDKDNIREIKSSFWDIKGNKVIGTTALPKYGAFVSEEKGHLFSDVSGKKLLEIGCGTPVDYFDYVYSIYGAGWTTDLESTFCRIASYLKNDGVFIFSGSHPIHKCVDIENDILFLKKSYFDESWYSVPLEGGAISL